MPRPAQKFYEVLAVGCGLTHRLLEQDHSGNVVLDPWGSEKQLPESNELYDTPTLGCDGTFCVAFNKLPLVLT